MTWDDFLAETGAYLSPEEQRACAQMMEEYAQELIGIGTSMLWQENSLSRFDRFAQDLGYFLARGKMPIEEVLRSWTEYRDWLLDRLYGLLEPTRPFDMYERLRKGSYQITLFTNSLIFGYNRFCADELVRAYEQQRNQVLDALPITVVVYDADGRCVFANRQSYLDNQTTPEQVIGKTRSELAGTYNTTAEADDVWGRVLQGERIKMRMQAVSEEGGMVTNDKELIPMQDEAGNFNGVVSVCYPADSEKTRLYNLQHQFSFVLNSMNSGLLILNSDAAVTGFNEKAEKIFGMKADAVIGRTLSELHEQYVDEADAEFAQDPVLMTAMEQGVPVRDVVLRFSVRGKKMTLRMDGNPITGVHGTAVGYILIIDDQTELVAMREAVDRNEKFALIGQFAAGIAHEIRNPLTTVYGFLQMYSKGSVKHENFLDLSQKLLLPELDRANSILSDFLMVSRPQAPQRTRVETREFFDEVVRLVESEGLLRGVMLVVEAPEVLPSLHVDVQQMKQVFLNLCKNGFDVTPTGGKLTLRALKNRALKTVQFHVADEGPGIPDKDLCHIFEPFYTTKDDGTGLGLPISHRIVEGHSGTLQVRSVQGTGTTFLISIPYEKSDPEA